MNQFMTTNVYLTGSTVIGGVYNGNTYTIFLGGGGLCVLPRELVDTYTTGNTPEERIEYIMNFGIYSKTPNKKENCKRNENASFLNLRNYE